jgi:hypothetical protein
MELLTSKKFKLPILYFISDRTEIKLLPVGVPFIFAGEGTKSHIIRILEFEILYQKAISTGLPFNFKRILLEAGYEDLKDYWWNHTVYIDYATGEDVGDGYFEEIKSISDDPTLYNQFIKDSTVYVDIKKIKGLNLFPIWLDKIEEAISTNIHNFAVYNPNMYNKKLDGMYGSLDLVSPDRNLIIIDISGSIPKGVSTTCLALGKNLAESFYTDLLITGSKSTLYSYENLHELNVNTIYEENDMDNDQVYFKKLVTSDVKHYKTCVCFGDNHHPGHKWINQYNVGSSFISDEDGKKMCKWKVDKIISFHTTSSRELAGYARWFDVEKRNIEHIKDWIIYLNK